MNLHQHANEGGLVGQNTREHRRAVVLMGDGQPFKPACAGFVEVLPDVQFIAWHVLRSC